MGIDDERQPHSVGVDMNDQLDDIKIQIEHDDKCNFSTPPALTAATSSSSYSSNSDESLVPPPPELARAQARIIALVPGAVHMPGLFTFQRHHRDVASGNSDPHADDVENTISSRGSRNDDDIETSTMFIPEREVLVHAELAVSPSPSTPIVMEADVMTCQTPPPPTPPLDDMSPKPLVFAEPLKEPKIGWNEIWNNRTVRIVLISFVLLLVFVVGIVVGLVMGLRNHNGMPPPPPNDHHEQAPQPPFPFLNGTFNNSSYGVNSTFSNSSGFLLESRSFDEDCDGDGHRKL